MTPFSSCALVLLSITSFLVAADPKPPAPDPFADAHARFIAFITPIVEKARATLNDPKIQWAQVQTEFWPKYLPDWRIYIRDGTYYADDPMIWAVSRDGQIIDLGNGLWRGVDGNNYFAVEKVSAFFKERKIKVQTDQQAVELTKLIESTAGAPSFVGMLRLNTKDYTIFDERFLRWMYQPKDHWKYTPAKTDRGWQVKVEYVGPPASIQAPPTYDLLLDEQQQFIDLRQMPRITP